MAPLRLLLAAGLAALPLTFLACGGTGTAGTDKTSSGDGGGGGESGAGGEGGGGASTCGACLGKDYLPCNEDGTPAAAETCAFTCVPGRGCLECTPGAPSCNGNEIRTCPESGKVAEGELVKTCDVGAGEVCLVGACKSGCDLAGGLPSNVGCEFWAVDLDQVDAINDPASAPWGIVVSNAGQAVANVTVEYNEAPVGQPPSPKALGQVSVPPGTLKTIKLPTRELDCGAKPNDMAAPGTCLSSNAYRVVSSAPVVVYQFNVFENAFSNDASLLLPTNALGKFYRILGWGAGHPVKIDFPGLPPIISRAYITVVGSQPDTKVTIKPTSRTHANTTSSPPIPTIQPGETVEFTIGPFDVINIETDTFSLEESTQIKNLADFTGSLVVSDKPVAVFSGAELTGAPGTLEIPKAPDWEDGDSCCLDHLEDQMFPLESIGKKYLITRSPVRSKGSYVEPDVLRFVGAAEPATVTTNLPPPFNSFTLQPGEIKDTWTQGHVVVDATAPVLIGQILISQGYVSGALTGDPSLTVFPPADQFRTEYVIPVPPSWSSNHVVIAARPSTQITLNGNPLGGCKIEPIGDLDGVTYEGRTCPLSTGAYYLSGNEPFGIAVYGYGSAGSYAYVGGADVKPIYEVPELKLHGLHAGGPARRGLRRQRPGLDAPR
jgi:hypothetical protein